MKYNSATLAVFLVVTVIICLIIAPKSTISWGEGMLDLLPDSEMETQSLFVPQRDAITATADAEISDLFSPDAEAVHSEDVTLEEKDAHRILIYHTHLTEAYRQDGENRYKESGDYRTNDKDYNVAAVGEVLKQELTAMGYEVIHDMTDHELPKLATAYERSVKTMEQYDDIDLYIDLHRDASGSANIDDAVEIDGQRCARMMFVVGRGYKSDGTEYDPMPDFEKNYALAEAVAENIRGYNSDFMRETRIKRGRYNQHISDACLLAEIGHNMNTLEEAKNAAKYLAAAIDQTLKAG